MNHTTRKKFGNDLFTWRAKKMSQVALGKKIGVSGGTVSSWERGATFPTLDNFEVLTVIIPALDTKAYRMEIMIENTGPAAPISPPPMPPTKNVRRVACSPAAFDKNLLAGKYNSQRGARRALTHAIHGPITWDSAAISTAKAHILNHFNPKKQKAAPPPPPPAASPAIAAPPELKKLKIHNWELARVDKGDPLIEDAVLGARLEYSRDRDFRRLIRNNLPELEKYGAIVRRAVTARQSVGRGGKGVREYEEEIFYLNEAQALLLCLLAGTDKAADIRYEVIQVYIAWRRGQHLTNTNSTPKDISISQQYALMSEKLELFAETVNDKFDARFDALLKVVELNTTNQNAVLMSLVEAQKEGTVEALKERVIEAGYDQNGWMHIQNNYWIHKDGRRGIGSSAIRDLLKQDTVLTRAMEFYGVEKLPSDMQMKWLADMAHIERWESDRMDLTRGTNQIHLLFRDPDYDPEHYRKLRYAVTVWTNYGGCSFYRANGLFNYDDARKRLAKHFNNDLTRVNALLKHAESMESKHLP